MGSQVVYHVQARGKTVQQAIEAFQAARLERSDVVGEIDSTGAFTAAGKRYQVVYLPEQRLRDKSRRPAMYQVIRQAAGGAR